MNPLRSLILTSAIIAATVGTHPAISQSQEFQPPEIKLIKLNFAGGTAVDYVAAVKQSSGGLNVYVAPEASQVAMPAIELNSVTASTALQLLHDRRTTVSGSMIQLVYDEIGSESPDAERVFSIQAKVSGRSSDFAQRSSVWSVAGTLAMGVKTEDVLTAIETALAMLSKDVPAAQIRFHEATGILIARGGDEQLETIHEVLNMLRVAAQERRAIENPSDAGKIELTQALQQRELMIQQMQVRIQALEAELAAAKKN